MALCHGKQHSHTIAPEPGDFSTIVCASHMRSRLASIVTVKSVVELRSWYNKHHDHQLQCLCWSHWPSCLTSLLAWCQQFQTRNPQFKTPGWEPLPRMLWKWVYTAKTIQCVYTAKTMSKKNLKWISTATTHKHQVSRAKSQHVWNPAGPPTGPTAGQPVEPRCLHWGVHLWRLLQGVTFHFYFKAIFWRTMTCILSF